MNIRSREKRPPPHKRLEGGDKLVLGGAVLTQTASHLDAEATGGTLEIEAAGGTSQVPQPTCSWTSRYRGRGREELGKCTIRIVSQSPVRARSIKNILVPPITKFWPKVPPRKRLMATKLNLRQKCVNQGNLT